MKQSWCSAKDIIVIIFFFLSIRTLNLSVNELKLIAKSRGIKGYKNKSKDELIKILSKPESKINSLQLRIKRSEKNSIINDN